MNRFTWIGLGALVAMGCSAGGDGNDAGGTTSVGGGSASSSSSSASASSGAGAAGGGGSSSSSAGGGTSSAGGGSSSSAGGGGAAASSSSSGAGGGGAPCTWMANANPCGNGLYCDAPGCGAGTCQLKAPTETGEQAPQCGCDGATYYNASVADFQGMAIAQAGVCPNAATCGGFANIQCKQPAALCRYEVPDSGGCNISDVGGTCWVLPQKCDAAQTTKTRACTSPQCADACTIIKNGLTFYVDAQCP